MSLEITDERVLAAAARLHEGGWSYSPRQLYYAVCADVETPPTRIASGEVGLGVLLILIGAITGQRILLAVLGLVGLAFLAVGIVTHVQERRPLPPARLLASSYPDFERRFLGGARSYAGLVGAPPPPRPDAITVVVCDRAETAAVIHANRKRIGDVAVAVAAQLPEVLAGWRVIVLHDCDPAGCALPADLRDRGADVADAGINPAELTGRRLQMIEGAPARLPRDLSGHLSTAETDWLRSGKRLELATETSEQLVARMHAAAAPGPSPS
ncbi:MAG: hypothetical protein M3019_08740 [Candidatus Dormibacteraeota bacterium]|nr:hypothetical protein [Candidatus Dormibacteraeota bacterium]